MMLLHLAALVVGAPSTPNYQVVSNFPIGGEGGWDCIEVDSGSHRLFISRGSHVMVLDVNSGKLVGDIPNTNGVHDIALVPKLNKGYISDGRDNALTVFDMKTLKEIKRIPVGNRPDVMAYDPSTNRVFSFNGGSQDTTVVDPGKDEVVGTIKLDGKPEFGRPDGHGNLFVNLEDKSAIDKVDIKALKVTGTWPLSPGEGPTGLAIDPKRGLLFSACDNEMMAVSDIASGKVVHTPKIGNGPDGAAFDPGSNLVFSPNGRDGTLTVIGPDFSVLQTVKTQQGARTMALDPKTHRIYLIAAKYEAAVAGQRPRMVPGSATIVVVAPVKG
ncbi:MAG TPA: YncE family protein [Fimbriimonadaceae bacterium]|nr:YncE family protein [Fimbriimonadaceae bacterium]